MIFAYVGLLLAAPSALPAVPQGEPAVAVATLAARRMLQRHPNVTVLLNPNASGYRTAPADPRGGAPLPLPVARLAATTGADVAQFDSVVSCAGPVCRFTRPTTYLTLSTPLLSGDSAGVTVTAVYPSGDPRRPLAYETVHFTLTRTPSGWRITYEEQLGIS